MSIQLRESRKIFPLSYLLEIYRIKKGGRYKMRRGITIAKPAHGKAFLLKDIQLSLKDIPAKVDIDKPERNIKDWKDWFSCLFVEYDKGIFLKSPTVREDSRQVFGDMVERYGLWWAQGYNNWCYLPTYSKNPIIQYYLAIDLIMHWQKELIKYQEKEFVIYLTGKKRTEIYLFST
jgi:hypothetical protein